MRSIYPIFQILILAPFHIVMLIIYKIKDFFYFLKERDHSFCGYGLHIYVGLFGSGKTSTMVRDVYNIALKFPEVEILTNMQLLNFPKHTKINMMRSVSDIVNAKNNTVVVLDELPTIFNSRDWKKNGIPPAVLESMLQVRKNGIMILGTAQRFEFIDSLIRNITATVRECTCILGRWNIIRVFDGHEYELTTGSLNRPAKTRSCYAFIQSDKMRKLYDTREFVTALKNKKYISDLEIKKRIE